MIGLDLILDGDGALAEYAAHPEKLEKAEGVKLVFLDHGMQSGLPSLMVCLVKANGRLVYSEISARLFTTAARAVLAKWPEIETAP